MAVKKGHKQTGVGVIPDDWSEKTLREISLQITDGDHITPRRTSQGYYLLSARNIRNGSIDLSDVDYVGQEEFARMRNRCAPVSGDILVSCSGNGLGRIAIVPEGLHCVLVRSAALVKTEAKKASSHFLHHWLRGRQAQNQIANGLSRAAQPNLFLGSIQQIRAPLPPSLAEQEAIAGALSDADAWIESLEQLIAKKRQIKQGAMQELLTGKRRLPGFSGKWETKRLGDVADADPENLDSSTSLEYEFNYISLEDVDCGILQSYSEQVFGSAPSRARRKVRKNDVLVSTVRPNLLSHLLFALNGQHWVCSTGFCVVRCMAGKTDPYFVFSHLFTNEIKKQIECLLTGSNYPSINSGDVKALQIPIPLYDEQNAIAGVLADIDSEIESLESKLSKAREIKQGMMQELLTGRIRLV